MAQSISRYSRELQKQAGSRDVLSLDTGGHNGQPLGYPAPAAEQAAYTELEEKLLLHTLVKELSPRQCEVVQLRLQGYGIHEVAQLQAVSDRTVRRLLRQIRERFWEVCRQ